MTGADPKRILLAHPHALVREVLAAALREDPDMEVVGQVADGRDAVAEASRLTPDLALIRDELPRLSGIETCQALRTADGDIRVVILDDGADTDVALAAVEAGAAGYLVLDTDLDGFLADLRRVADGETVLPPRMLGRLLRRLVRVRREATRTLDRYLRLTPRERQVLELLVAGSDQDAVAASLVISPETARTHIQHVLTKLEVGSRHEAAALAVEQGWIEPHIPRRA